MPDYTYEALDRTGAVTRGTITARDDADAAVRVRTLGVFPTRIYSTAGSRNGSAAANGGGHSEAASRAFSAAQFGGKKISRLQVLLFTREMSDLLDAGLPMDRAFSVLIDQTEQPGMHAMLTTMQGDIRAGQPLSAALLKFPRDFAPLYANMIRAGEVSGELPAVMTRLADFLEKEQIRRSQIIGVLTYPMVLVSVAVLAVIFLLTFVIPKLKTVFVEIGAELPLPTRMLLGVSTVIGSYWWLLLLLGAGGTFAFRAWLQTEAGRRTFDGFKLHLPLFGVLTQKISAARFVRTLGTLLGGGVPILESLDISASAVGNTVATEAILNARGGVRQGETLHEAMERSDIFLPVVKHMTAVGEETGRLPAMLVRTADTLDFEVDNAMRRLTSLVEPLVVLLMGGFVGFVVLSILLPIMQINTLVR